MTEGIAKGYPRRALLIVCVPMLLSVFGSATADEETTDLLALTRAYDDAWGTMDWEQVAPFHTDDITYYWRGGLGATSQSEFEKLFKLIASDLSSYSAEFVNPRVRMLGPDVGLVSFKFVGKLVNHADESSDYSGAMTYVWERHGSEWKIALIHESAPVDCPVPEGDS